MNIRLKKRSIKSKLNIVILGTCSAVLFLTFLIVVATQWFLYKRNAMEELSSLARIVGDNSAAALMFEDRQVLGKSLESLGQRSSLNRSAFYRIDGTVMVELSYTLEPDNSRSLNIPSFPKNYFKSNETMSWVKKPSPEHPPARHFGWGKNCIFIPSGRHGGIISSSA